ncbi:MAG TPA: DsbA family protein [Actinoplanes sp.]|nr:DsbA family protein [Actinoplanes sp.]
MEVTFFFDPACPFTWSTSRWLLAVAPERGLQIHWRAFSLSLLNPDPPEQYRAAMAASSKALRLVESLRAEGRPDAVGAFYTAIGERTFAVGAMITDAIVAEAAEVAEVEKATAVLADAGWDDAVRESHETALTLAGPGIGSPVLQVAGAVRGLHGPIIDKVPGLEESLVIWDATAALIKIESFFEVKRGRG